MNKNEFITNILTIYKKFTGDSYSSSEFAVEISEYCAEYLATKKGGSVLAEEMLSLYDYARLDGQNAAHDSVVQTYNQIIPHPRGYVLKSSDAWCAATVSAMAYRAGITDFPFECSCEEMRKGFERAGRWVENDAYRPAIGDVVFYDWQDTGKGDNTGWPDHVGVVCEISTSSYLIVEGNRSGKVDQRRLNANARYIRGFGAVGLER